MLMSKQDRKNAELAGEWLAVDHFLCVHTRRALRTKFAKVDFWASDIMGMRNDGSKVFIQVTAGQDSAVSQRRKKLEKYSWHPDDTICVAVLRKEKQGRSYQYYFIIHKYNNLQGNDWDNHLRRVDVPREWFKAYKDEI